MISEETGAGLQAALRRFQDADAALAKAPRSKLADATAEYLAARRELQAQIGFAENEDSDSGAEG